MANSVNSIEDPTPSKFWKTAVVVALVLVLVGLVILIAGGAVVGGIITLLGAIFGVGGGYLKTKQP